MASPPLLSIPLVLAMPFCFLFTDSVCELHFEPASSYNSVIDRGFVGGGTTRGASRIMGDPRLSPEGGKMYAQKCGFFLVLFFLLLTPKKV